MEELFWRILTTCGRSKLAAGEVLRWYGRVGAVEELLHVENSDVVLDGGAQVTRVVTPIEFLDHVLLFV